MIGVAVMGYGVVGSGVVELIDQNNKIFSEKIGQDIAVKHILDVRDFPGNKYESLITKDFNDILSDPETEIVCETIGGAKVAYDFTKRCLCAGKSVVDFQQGTCCDTRHGTFGACKRARCRLYV